MKLLLIVTLALLLLLAACIGNVSLLEENAAAVLAPLDAVAEALTVADWQQADRACARAAAAWRQVQPHWEMMIHHDAMNDIGVGLLDLQTALRQRDQTAAEKELTTLRYYLTQVPENERVDWSNIL